MRGVFCLKILDLGCGNNPYKSSNKTDEVIGIDFYNNQTASVKWDLNSFPYPFKDNEFDKVIAFHVLEHVDDLPKTMDELHRITKSKGVIEVRVPHFTSCWALTHYTHKKAFGFGTFSPVLINKSWERYSSTRFKLIKQELRWFIMRDLESSEGRFSKFYPLLKELNYVINKLANNDIFLTERFFYHLVGGFDEMYYLLEVVK